MDVASRLQQLEELITSARTMPLSSSALVNREEVMELLEEMREALPEEIKQARWVVKDRENLLVKARRDAEGIIQQALSEQGRLVSREEVVREANEEAERILEEARQQARQIRLEGEDYMDQRLAAFEATLTRTTEQIERIRQHQEQEFGRIQDQLSKTLQQVQRGRERLRGGSVAEEQLAEQQPEGQQA
jgi:vacuolar-type H+-ATPase subunit H